MKVVGNYNLGKTIGEGTFGMVKLGTHTLTGELVAIKILEKEKIKEQADLERVAREINILKQIRHPNIVQLYEIVETERSLYLIMEYCPGGELFDHITKHQRLKEPESAQYLMQILSGVEYLHTLRIMHRDLKPENLLLDANKQIKIADFGLSNTYLKDQHLKTSCGSPCYAAPEVIVGKGYMGKQADIWSCGVILYAMLCGRLPFEDPITANLYRKIQSAEYTIPPHVTPLAANLLQCILNIDPNHRYSIEQIINHYWITTMIKEPTLIGGIMLGQTDLNINQTVLRELPQYTFNIDYATQCILNNRHNQVTTTYYLLLKKHQTEEPSKENTQLQSERVSLKQDHSVRESQQDQPRQEIAKFRQASQSIEKQPDTLFPTAQQIIEKAQTFRLKALEEDKSPVASKSKVLTTRNEMKLPDPPQKIRRQISPIPTSHTQLQTYDGPFNTNQLSFIDQNVLIRRLNQYLCQQSYDMQCSNNKKCEYRISKNALILDLFIYQLTEGVNIIKCNRVSGDESEYQETYRQIINVK